MLAIALLPVIIGVLVLLMIVFFIGGYIVTGRRREALAKQLEAQVEAADAALAEARAGDRGWDRAAIEDAARAVLTERRPGADIRNLHLVQVVDRPGTDADEAVLRAVLGDGSHETVTLGRRDGAWVAAQPR
jgi:hypothetical protein